MKLSRNRRGQSGGEESSFNFLTYATMAVITLLLLLFIAYQIHERTADDPVEARCRASIQAHSALSSVTADKLANDIECAPKLVTINTGDEDAAKRELAELMRSCWERWGKGDVELYDEEAVYCNPCAFVTLRRPSLHNFDTYLATTSVPDSKETYADYFAPTESATPEDEVPASLSSKTQESILPTGSYAVLFVYARGGAVYQLKEHFTKDLDTSLATVGKSSLVGGGIGVVGGTLAVIFTGGGAAVPIVAGIVCGAGAGAFNYFFGEAEEPAWLSMVLVEPNDPTALRDLGCQAVEQHRSESGIEDV